ncbi:ankyrin repeat domain-containing protein [bacterium]|nr:ankyrin repeat domain-containing protein [bacterium]
MARQGRRAGQPVDLRSVEPNGDDGWRVRIHHGKCVTRRPTRPSQAEAYADQKRANQCSSREDMIAYKATLKCVMPQEDHLVAGDESSRVAGIGAISQEAVVNPIPGDAVAVSIAGGVASSCRQLVPTEAALVNYIPGVPKRKLGRPSVALERLGAAQPNANGEGWRARMELGYVRHSGPTRFGKAAAESYLIRMRSVAPRAEVCRVVADLRSEAPAAAVRIGDGQAPSVSYRAEVPRSVHCEDAARLPDHGGAASGLGCAKATGPLERYLSHKEAAAAGARDTVTASPLLLAIGDEVTGHVRRLFHGRADLNAQDEVDCFTPLLFAPSCGHVVMARLLCSAKADVNASLQCATRISGQTLLIVASIRGHTLRSCSFCASLVRTKIGAGECALRQWSWEQWPRTDPSSHGSEAAARRFRTGGGRCYALRGTGCFGRAVGSSVRIADAPLDRACSIVGS